SPDSRNIENNVANKVGGEAFTSAISKETNECNMTVRNPPRRCSRFPSGELAGARDTEVMAQRCAAMLDELPDDPIFGPVAAAVTRSFQRRQADARQVALAALDGDRYPALHVMIDTLLADPPCTRADARRG